MADSNKADVLTLYTPHVRVKHNYHVLPFVSKSKD